LSENPSDFRFGNKSVAFGKHEFKLWHDPKHKSVTGTLSILMAIFQMDLH